MLMYLQYLQMAQKALNIVQEQMAEVRYVEQDSNDEAVYTAEEVREVLGLKDYEYISGFEYELDEDSEALNFYIVISGNVTESWYDESGNYDSDEANWHNYIREIEFNIDHDIDKMNYIADMVETVADADFTVVTDDGIILLELDDEVHGMTVYADFSDVAMWSFEQIGLERTAKEIYPR